MHFPLMIFVIITVTLIAVGFNLHIDVAAPDMKMKDDAMWNAKFFSLWSIMWILVWYVMINTAKVSPADASVPASYAVSILCLPAFITAFIMIYEQMTVMRSMRQTA